MEKFNSEQGQMQGSYCWSDKVLNLGWSLGPTQVIVLRELLRNSLHSYKNRMLATIICQPGEIVEWVEQAEEKSSGEMTDDNFFAVDLLLNFLSKNFQNTATIVTTSCCFFQVADVLNKTQKKKKDGRNFNID